MLTGKLCSSIGMIILFSNMPCLSAEHPFNQVDADHKKNLACAGEASRVAYYSDSLEDKSVDLKKNGYACVEYCREKNGVFSIGYYNDRTNNIIVAHRGTVISEPNNLFADLGVLEAIVRENECISNPSSLSKIPEHSAFTALLTHHVQRHIALFLGDRTFSISSLVGAEKLLVDRILNFNHLYNSVINTYQTGWGLGGTFLAGIGSILSAAAPPVGLGMLAVGAIVGGMGGNAKAHSVIDDHLLKGRETLANTLDIMYQNTKNIIFTVNKKYPGVNNSLTVTGHSLGAAGALGVMARFKSESDIDVNAILFNAPGGHSGLVKIWSTHSEVKNMEPVCDADHVKRSSCIVSSFGNDPVSRQYVFAPLPYRGKRGLLEWKDMLIPSHSIDNLVSNMGW
ncbi:MAG: hypothetical protein HEEMFOPI_01866 [Holosporales bacterium]